MEPISIINKTMELAECKQDWFFDEKHGVWCLEDILYTPCPTTPKFQRMSIFVPKAYMSEPGIVDPKGTMQGYTAVNAPVIFENNSAGYMQMPHIWLDGPRCYAKPYLDHGYVYVSCGNRGLESKDSEGKYCGRAPINLVDLKTGIRFLRHNRSVLPGNFDRIISIGWSAGGAMSTLLAVTGDNENYDSYLKENGAFMDESDAVFASQIYCPIIDLEHADLAYEWNYKADKENENCLSGPAGVMTTYQEELSKNLAENYIGYLNSLSIKDADGSPFTLNQDGRSGRAYDCLMKELSASATKYLKKLAAKELPVTYSVEDYLSGNYTYIGPAPDGPLEEPEGEGPQKPDNDLAASMRGFAGPGVGLDQPEEMPKGPDPDELFSLGEMLSRPPKGMEGPAPMPPTAEYQGKDKHNWLTWDGEKAQILDLDSYVLGHRRRMKPCVAFDALKTDSGECRVFGNADIREKHFSESVAEVIAMTKDTFPKEYEEYAKAYQNVAGDEAQKRQKYLINPYSFINTKETSTQAKHYRIRVGANDADTSFMIGLTLAKALQNAGKSVDYALVWEQPHSEADYEGEVLDWIDSIV